MEIRTGVIVKVKASTVSGEAHTAMVLLQEDREHWKCDDGWTHHVDMFEQPTAEEFSIHHYIVRQHTRNIEDFETWLKRNSDQQDSK